MGYLLLDDTTAHFAILFESSCFCLILAGDIMILFSDSDRLYKLDIIYLLFTI